MKTMVAVFSLGVMFGAVLLVGVALSIGAMRISVLPVKVIETNTCPVFIVGAVKPYGIPPLCKTS